LVGLVGLHVTDVERGRGGGLVVTVESAPTVMGCSVCGVVSHGHGSTMAEFVDAPSFGRPVRLRWRKHRWVCPEPTCLVGSFVEQDPAIALPGRLLTIRAIRWAIGQLRDEQASIEGLSRQLGIDWKTLWRAIRPVLETAAEDEGRFEGVTTLGVDEHIWHHVSPIKRGPKELTGMVDLTRHPHPRTGKLVVRARLLDLVPGRSGTVYKTWLKERGERFRAGVKIATLDPFQGYKNAIDEQLSDAEAVIDAFHVVKLGATAVDDVRCRVQQHIHGHRGHKGDPLYGIRHLLRASAERLTEKRQHRLATALAADERHVEVEVAYLCSQELRSVYHQPTMAKGRAVAEKVVASFPTCPIPEIRRLGKTLKKWRTAFLAYFTTNGASNGGTEAIIIWSPVGGVVDVADGSRKLCGRHVLWSMWPTSLTGPGSGCRPWIDSRDCRVYDDVGIPL